MAAATIDLTPAPAILPDASMSPRRPATAASPAAYDRLVLTGFMGCGKTTLGGLLAEALAWRFVDLDQEIERREGRTVPQIFAEDGEAAFRRIESAALASVLGKNRTVIALGGGVPEELGNRLQLEQSPRTAVVYLEAPFEELLARCQAQENATERPNLADPAAARERFERRTRLYQRMARFRIVTTGRSVDDTLTDLLGALR